MCVGVLVKSCGSNHPPGGRILLIVISSNPQITDLIWTDRIVMPGILSMTVELRTQHQSTDKTLVILFIQCSVFFSLDLCFREEEKICRVLNYTTAKFFYVEKHCPNNRSLYVLSLSSSCLVLHESCVTQVPVRQMIDSQNILSLMD